MAWPRLKGVPVTDSKISRAEARKLFLENCRDLYTNYKPPIHIFAIDPSRTACGWCRYSSRISMGVIRPSYDGLTSFRKVVAVTQEIESMIKKEKPQFIVMEDYAYGVIQGRELAGETAGCIKYMLLKQNLPVIQPSPTQVKAYVGAKEKSNIMMEVLDKWHMKTKDNNEADAFVLAMIGRSIFDVARAAVKNHLKHNDTKMESALSKLLTNDGLTSYQIQVLYRLIYRKGNSIWL